MAFGLSPPDFPNQFTIQKPQSSKDSAAMMRRKEGSKSLEVQVELLFSVTHSSSPRFADFQFLILSQLISFGLKVSSHFPLFFSLTKVSSLRESKIDLFHFWIGDRRTFILISIFRVVGSENGTIVNSVTDELHQTFSYKTIFFNSKL